MSDQPLLLQPTWVPGCAILGSTAAGVIGIFFTLVCFVNSAGSLGLAGFTGIAGGLFLLGAALSFGFLANAVLRQ